MPLTSSIPLLCNICPRRPKFSDVSHLLTHIASKGHLSHYYKLKVRSSTERSAKELIDAYDQWYRNWNVEKLMAERMRVKDRKKSKVQGNGKTKQKERRGRSGPSNDSSGQLLEDISALTDASRTRILTPDVAQLHRNYTPRMQLWNTSILTPISSSVSDYEHNGSSFDITDRLSLASVTNSSSAASLSLDNDAISNEDDSFIADNAKLKGVYWPGMDIFDSATPRMRRKRNQKKDVSVVEQLESNSLEVEPTEVIFAPDGTEWRSRTISGMPYDDNYPFQDLSPSHQKLQASERVPLAEIDGNRLGSSSNGPGWSHQNRRRGGNIDEKRNLNAASRDIASNAGSNEFHMALNEPNRKRKKNFDVFKDEVNFSNPAGLSYLTAEFASPGLAASENSQSYNNRSACLREENVNNQYLGISRECRSRRNPRRSCQPYQRQSRRCPSSSSAFSHRNNDNTFPSSSQSSHLLAEPIMRLPQHATTGCSFRAHQLHGQSIPQSQMEQQQEQQHNHHNHLLNFFTPTHTDGYLTHLHGPFSQNSDTVAKLGSVLQDFPYYLSQMPYLTDTLAISNVYGNAATVDPSRSGNFQRSGNPNLFSQSGFHTDYSQGSFNAYDLSLEEQLKLYASNDAVGSEERGFGGSLQHGNCYEYCHQQDHLAGEREAESEDDQRTISAGPSER